jgi:hypothetical protein
MSHEDELYLCDYLTEYVTDQLNEVDRLRYERHLASCVSCRKDVLELQESWDAMPFTADLINPPADLKEQVMGGIFAEAQPQFIPFTVGRSSRQSYWLYTIAATVVLALLIGTIWNYQLTKERQLYTQVQMEQPSRIMKIFSLSAQTTSMNYAYGVACIVNQGNQTELVVYLFDVETNKGDEAYQVWLLEDSVRTNAGTFQVGDDKIGVLTYPMVKEELTFDSIGITLEPDSKGNEPRGQKMFANSEQIIWN